MRNLDVQHEMPFLRLLAKENVLSLMHDLGMTEHKDEIMNLFDEQVVAHICRSARSTLNKFSVTERMCALNVVMVVTQDTDKDNRINFAEFIHLYNEVINISESLAQQRCRLATNHPSPPRCAGRTRGRSIGSQGSHSHMRYSSPFGCSNRPVRECH